MSSTTAFLASFLSILIGTAIGMILKKSLPAEMLEGGSKEAIRLGAGFLATMAALVIGLMIASAKNSFDSQNTNIRQLGTNAVLVDQMLTKYGPEARTARPEVASVMATASSMGCSTCCPRHGSAISGSTATREPCRRSNTI